MVTHQILNDSFNKCNNFENNKNNYVNVRMKSPQRTKKITKLTAILLLASTCNVFANTQLDSATEQRIIREQDRVIQNQQIEIEANKRKRESEIIERQWVSTKAAGEKESFWVGFGENKLSEGQIEEKCVAINSINDLTSDEIPSGLPLVDFFRIYLSVKALYPEHLNKFSCAAKLESQAIPLFSLEREPLEKPYPQSTSDLQILHLHREITRNLYKIVNVVYDANGKIIEVTGISNGLPFVSQDQNLIQQVLNPKLYLKFTSSGEHHFIPLKNYQNIKKYLTEINKLELKRVKKGDLTSPGFGLTYSAFVNAFFVEAKKDHQFKWIDEIRQVPYLSFYDLLNYLINFDKDSNQILQRTVLFSYIYNHRLSDSSLLLVKAINELGLAPKSVLPLIEKSLRSGNKDFCSAVKNPERPIATNQLNKKQRTVLNVIIKNCPEAGQIKIQENDRKISNSSNKRTGSR